VLPLEADIAQRCGALIEETSAPHLAAVGWSALPWAMPPSASAAPPMGSVVDPLCLAPQENHPALTSLNFGAPQAVRGPPGRARNARPIRYLRPASASYSGSGLRWTVALCGPPPA